MKLIHLNTQTDRFHLWANKRYFADTLNDAGCFNRVFNPFARYTLWHKNKEALWHVTDAPDITTINAGHFAVLPAGDEFSNVVAVDTEKPLHICTVGDADPRDIRSYGRDPNSDDAVSPKFTIAIKTEDIALRIHEVRAADDTFIAVEDGGKQENLLLRWFLDNGIVPEHTGAGYMKSRWRIQYPGVKPDSILLKHLGYVMIDGRLKSLNQLLATQAGILDDGHPLQGFLGINYDTVESAYRQSADGTTERIVYALTGDKYAICSGLAKFEGEKFRFNLTTVPMDFVMCPFDSEVFRKVLRLRGGTAPEVWFDFKGQIQLRRSEIPQLGLERELVAEQSGREVRLLPKNWARWKVVTKEAERKYHLPAIFSAYRTDGGEPEPIRVYYDFGDATLTKKETKKERLARLGMTSYAKEVKTEQWSDFELLQYAECRKEVESGKYTMLTKGSNLVQGVFSQYVDPEYRTLAWVLCAVPGSPYGWRELFELLSKAGMGEYTCMTFFLRNDSIRIEDALVHYAELKEGSAIRNYLESILDTYQKLGEEKLKQLLLARV